MRFLVIGLLAVVLAGCYASESSSGPVVDATAPTPAPSIASSAASPAGAAGSCIISIPTQMGADLTPVVISYPDADDATCAGYLATQQAKATDAYAKAHPASRVSALPAGAPACSVTSQGIKLIVYGTTAAQSTCTTLGAGY